MAVTRKPLTPEQQALVLSVEYFANVLVRRVPYQLIRAFGREAVKQEAMLAACKAAADFDPVRFPNMEFSTFAWMGMKKHMLGVIKRSILKDNVWKVMPAIQSPWDKAELIHVGELVPGRDHDPNRDPFHWWHTDEAKLLRRGFTLRYRLVIYLVLVEGLTYVEVGEALGVSKQRAQQMWTVIDQRFVADATRRQISGRTA
jgi:DNA-directed RNA polymerase specialized sigma24 family protein